jgi:cytochrome P450
MVVNTDERPPGPSGLPFIGHSYHMFQDPLSFGQRCAEQYGDIVTLQVAGHDALQLSHPDYVQYVLEDNFENYQKGEFYRTELELLGDGLLVSEGELWRQQRQIIGPMFHPDRIKSYTQTMIDYAERASDRLPPDKPIAIDEHMQQLTLEIIAQALFTVDIGTETAGISAAVNDVMDEARLSSGIPISVPDWIPTPGNIRYNRAINTFDAVVMDIIDEHRAQDDPPDDVVSKLLAARDEDGAPLPDTQIRDEVLTLLLAGHDTTALALGYIWYLLSNHPDIQKRLFRELNRVIGDRSPKLEDLFELTFTEQIIKEALRLYPPVYLFAREPKTDDEIGGYDVAEGTLLLFNQWVIQRDNRFFDNPDEFDPDRWTAEFEETLHPYAYYPFSGGPRRCIGEQFAMQELKIIVATLFNDYRFELAFDPPLELDPKVSLRPDSPITVYPRPR